MIVNDRLAFVTGGLGGIGTAVCQALNTEGLTVIAGCHPSETDQIERWQAQFSSSPPTVIACDVADADSTATILNQLVDRLGPVDTLVNCAGITRDSTLRKMDVQQWSDVVETNLSSVFNVTQPLLNPMLEHGFGRIINIASVNAQKGQFGQTNYSAAKAGIHGFTMSLAQEVASKGVTVNTVAPGYVDTRMTQAIRADIRQSIVDTIPLGRMADVNEVAHAVRFLAQDESAYITGILLPVNGGMYMSF